MSNSVVRNLLERVSYKEDNEYVPSEFALNVVNFIKLMTDGKGESSPTPVFHYKMLDALNYSSRHAAHSRVANLVHRGGSKTSLHSEVLFFYLAVFGKLGRFGEVDAIIYVSDTIENGVRSLKKNMEARYQGSEFLQKFIPKAVFNETEIWLTNANGRKTGIRMFGATSGIRGTKIFGKRPQLAILDDLLSDKNARSEGIITLIKDTIYKGVDQALDPTQRKIVFLGTPFSENDPLYSAIESGVWLTNVFPVCEKFPCTPEEFRGSWEARFGYDFVASQYDAMSRAGQVNAFYQELMLNIVNSDESLVDVDVDVTWFSRREFEKNRGSYSIYITTDFAVSSRAGADNSVISVWAVSSRGDTLLIDGSLGRQSMDVTIDELFRLVSKWTPVSVGVETNGQQGGFIAWMRNEMVSRNVFFTFAKGLNAQGNRSSVGIRSSTDKLTRFNVMLPDIRAGKLWMCSDLKGSGLVGQALRELSSVTSHGIMSKHDDWLDTYTMLGHMRLLFPDAATPTKSSLVHPAPIAHDVFASSTLPVSDVDGYFV